MCYIFTCCTWMIDCIQRTWVFVMISCMATAICCVFAVTSISGMALGYNYSLSEYIDLKETTVTVFLTRGVFDDELTDETDWRRSGRRAPIDELKGDDLITGAPDEPEQMPVARRRVDDSILQSEENFKFQGNLMKLTTQIPYKSTVTEPVTNDEEMIRIIKSHPHGSVRQFKAIQALINKRKLKAPRDSNVKRMSTNGYQESMLAHVPDSTVNYRKMMAAEKQKAYLPPISKDIDRFAAARKAVPDQFIGDPENWKFPKMSSSKDDYLIYKYPKPVYMNFGPIRPTQPATSKVVPSATKAETGKQMDKEPTPIDSGFANKDEMVGDIANKFEMERPLGAELVKSDLGGWKKSEIYYYEEDVKGLSIRKRRNINTIKNNLVKKTNLKNNILKGDKLKDKENNAKPKESTHNFNTFVTKLLSSNKPLSSVVTASKGYEETTNIKTIVNGDNNVDAITKEGVKMIRTMF